MSNGRTYYTSFGTFAVDVKETSTGRPLEARKSMPAVNDMCTSTGQSQLRINHRMSNGHTYYILSGIFTPHRSSRPVDVHILSIGPWHGLIHEGRKMYVHCTSNSDTGIYVFHGRKQNINNRYNLRPSLEVP